MSKEKVLQFLNEAAKNQEIKSELQSISNPEELVDLGKAQGFNFSPEHVDAVLADLKQQPGFFGKLVESMLAIFSPSHDDYPNVGVEPFSGDPNPNP
ncbi:Nif11-like leader peptide family natural product precursor [Gloeocapsa sp. PCC 73106]|uniref:Nif11-like leader peptide family natural product precursor n=1 Tax=Gloeocapsa sp. PCC 73106 TaxID=102232 RepID=UPI0002ACF388|nr:Nif11-like leader peptide family natural product precursor [Gloeocapsa sp. PCC 73106]ELR96747.1 Nitrogen fixation protein of unknown function [Gloeocapsa sp. PCC 73106]